MTTRDRFKKALTYYKLNQSAISILAGFLFVLLVGVVAFSLTWSKLRQPKPVADEQPAAESEVLSELPTDLSYYENDQGQLLVYGLPVTYRVQAGDSTWVIAEAFYGEGSNFIDIEVANDLEPNQMLEVGQELLIPSVPVRGRVAEQMAAESDSDSDEAGVETPEADQSDQDATNSDASDANKNTYTVVKGDSLWKIAEQRYGDGMAWTKIYQANLEVVGSNPDLIYPDQSLSLPN